MLQLFSPMHFNHLLNKSLLSWTTDPEGILSRYVVLLDGTDLGSIDFKGNRLHSIRVCNFMLHPPNNIFFPRIGH